MQIVMAGFDKVDPAIDVFCVVRDGSRMTVEWASSPIREFRRALDEGMAVVGEYALHRRIGAASRVCVLTT